MATREQIRRKLKSDGIEFILVQFVDVTGAVKVKIGSYKGVVSSTAPEYEDCERIARATKVTTREVYEAAFAAAIKGEFIDV